MTHLLLRVAPFCAVLLAVASPANAGEARDLSRVAIVPPKGSSPSLPLAVEELKAHLARVCGSVVAPDAPFRFVFAKPADAPEPKPFASHYRIDGATVWFWGDDSADTWRVKHKGTLFAVERFAERELGLKWYWPGEDGVDCERRTSVELPARADEVFCPKLAKNVIRNYKAYHEDRFKDLMTFTPKPIQAEFDAFRARSFEERELWLKRQCVQLDCDGFAYGHAFVHWKEKYFKDHPECFNLNAKTGERGFTGPAGPLATKRCVSNETNDELILREWCAGGTNEYLNVCENDWTFFCECDKCCAMDAPLPGEKPLASVTDRYVAFWNRLARKARAIRPDVKLVTYAYAAYRLAPRRERIEYPDNIVFGFVPSLMDDFHAEFLKWRAAGVKHCFLRPNYHHYYGSIPRGVEKVIYDNFQECRALGLMGVDYDATYRRDVMDIEYFVTARVIADPSRSFESIVSDYYGAWGAAAPAVRAYFERVRAAGEAARARYMRNTKEKFEVIDDSQLSILQCYGRSEAELQAELDGLRAARATYGGRLTAVQLKRFDRLLARAENALLTYRFLTAQTGDRAEFRKRGETLAAFRVKEAPKMEDCWPFVFGNYFGERRTWRRLLPWTPVDVAPPAITLSKDKQ